MNWPKDATAPRDTRHPPLMRRFSRPAGLLDAGFHPPLMRPRRRHALHRAAVEGTSPPAPGLGRLASLRSRFRRRWSSHRHRHLRRRRRLKEARQARPRQSPGRGQRQCWRSAACLPANAQRKSPVDSHGSNFDVAKSSHKNPCLQRHPMGNRRRDEAARNWRVSPTAG